MCGPKIISIWSPVCCNDDMDLRQVISWISRYPRLDPSPLAYTNWLKLLPFWSSSLTHHPIRTPPCSSLFALQSPTCSPWNSSNFHISTFSLTLSSASSPALHAACRCGAETAIKILSSAIGTTPSLCTRLMAVRLCFSLMDCAIESMLRRASGW